jgi:hypothetical protein
MMLVHFADLSDALRYPPVRIAHEVGYYVGVEQIAL